MKHYFNIAMVAIFCLGLCACQTQTTQENGVVGNAVSDQAQAAKLNVQLGLSYMKQGNMPRAKEKLLLAFNQNPSAQTYGALAYFYEQTGDIQKAKMNYLAAIDQNDSLGAPHNNYGAFLCRQKEYEAADAQFQLAINDPTYVNSANALENAGLCAVMANQTDKAIDYFKVSENNFTLLIDFLRIFLK